MWKRLGLWLLNGFLFLCFAVLAGSAGVRFQHGAIIAVTIISVIMLVAVALSSSRMMDGEHVMRTSILTAVLFNAIMWSTYYIHTGWMWQFIKSHVLR